MKYKYKIVKGPEEVSTKDLNAFGELGWELVQVIKGPDFIDKPEQ